MVWLWWLLFRFLDQPVGELETVVDLFFSMGQGSTLVARDQTT
ncbi:hypothetical protein AZ78_1942 [Lysobacter capsici AZ78]|uniref:Uncharacterized protein n=1 Tax=Lysobacter capsici AZ78 TaxID=1444315 RepID=A0A108U8A3_9GAMM|nr:hypothetical protein AZ78_1942 [Lysobacter capsici AZ78]